MKSPKRDKKDKYRDKRKRNSDDNDYISFSSHPEKKRYYNYNNEPSSSKYPDCKSRKNSDNDGEDFSFQKYTYELNKVFSANQNLVQDVQDFWAFVKKYEAVQSKLGKAKEPAPSSQELNSIGVAINYHKNNSINFKLNIKFGELFARVPATKSLSEIRLNEFRDIIILYLDFKQKEKFSKLKKLRESQANLPVAKHRDEIIEAVNNERVVIIAGDTGCGKSTQVPQYLYSAGYKKIACTQPRRIACISLAKRVSFETLTENSNQVGYQIRFEKQKNQDTKITFITEGLLLRQVSDETGLSQYDVIVLDEVHERHLHGDFLLGIMKCLIHQRDDLKLVLMSATINIQLFSQYFSKEEAKIIQVNIIHLTIFYFILEKLKYNLFFAGSWSFVSNKTSLQASGN